MQTLATKYRPKTWSDVTEQSLTVEIFKSLCEQPELPIRNFLFVGSAGCGKTTIARLVGNMVNDNKGQIIELDAASNNGVEAIRGIVQQAMMYPIGSKYKVFILDEVHALSQAAWQILLKPLEEGPAKSIFLLCTTNPEKIPATILSRVQTFQFSKISLSGISNRLKYVLDSEVAEGRTITYSDEAVNYIAKLAQGGMRDALTLLDKALAYNTDISMENITKALNLPEYSMYFELLAAYSKRDNTEIAKLIDEIYNSGVNFVKWMEGWHAFVMNVVKYIFLQDINMTMIPSTYQDKISKYGPNHAAVCLKLANILVKMCQELKSTQYLQEVALTYLCSMR